MEFRFSMINTHINQVGYIEIPDEELEPSDNQMLALYPAYRKQYRQNVIERYLEKWAVSNLKLSWEEVNENEGHADQPDPAAKQSQT